MVEKWEYGRIHTRGSTYYFLPAGIWMDKATVSDQDLFVLLNRLGAEGWELISTAPMDILGNPLLLKRKVSS